MRERESVLYVFLSQPWHVCSLHNNYQTVTRQKCSFFHFISGLQKLMRFFRSDWCTCSILTWHLTNSTVPRQTTSHYLIEHTLFCRKKATFVKNASYVKLKIVFLVLWALHCLHIIDVIQCLFGLITRILIFSSLALICYVLAPVGSVVCHWYCVHCCYVEMSAWANFLLIKPDGLVLFNRCIKRCYALIQYFPCVDVYSGFITVNDLSKLCVSTVYIQVCKVVSRYFVLPSFGTDAVFQFCMCLSAVREAESDAFALWSVSNNCSDRLELAT